MSASCLENSTKAGGYLEQPSLAGKTVFGVANCAVFPRNEVDSLRKES
jgi:hypothetical protein